MPSRGRILVVDDEVNARISLVELLHAEGFEVEAAADGFKALGKYESFDPHIVLTDLRMPGMTGIELLMEIRGAERPAEVIVMTGFGDVGSAIAAMRAGAADYLTKPLHFDELIAALDKVLAAQAAARQAAASRGPDRERPAPGNIIGAAPPIRRVFDVIDQVGPSKASVLILGESGTGKELVANALHQRSARANGPFIKLHCAALSESLLESELFGHERGAFTGAIARKNGRFSLADGGTLFLDEIGEISQPIQIKLLRFLQEREFERVGGTQTLHVDVRVIAATHRNLPEEIAKGRFREDLYYRLNVVTIDVPSLRERRADIPALVRFFTERYARENAKSVAECTPEALEQLMGYAWPGNVRELENAIERAVVLVTGTAIEPRHLPASIKPAARPAGPPRVPGATLAELERYAILETMKMTGGSTSRAAEFLGISARTLRCRLHKYRAAPRTAIQAARKTTSG